MHPATPAEGLSRVIESLGWAWKGVATADDIGGLLTAPDWSAAVVSLETDSQEALRICRALRNTETDPRPLFVVCGLSQLGEIDIKEGLFDDFCLGAASTEELVMRLSRILLRVGPDDRPELIEYGPLALNLETYQASVSGQPLDLTYMEYELLRFLAARPGKVFTRETLLSRVWGYEYYGGARTVDVHVRRLRAKLGEQHANLIQTVRSVGYRFGQAKRWPA